MDGHGKKLDRPYLVLIEVLVVATVIFVLWWFVNSKSTNDKIEEKEASIIVPPSPEDVFDGVSEPSVAPNPLEDIYKNPFK